LNYTLFIKYNIHMVQIADVMVRDVLTAEKTATVLQMAELIYNAHVGAITIIDKNRFPIGIVTERDIIQAMVVYKENASRKQAQDIMSSPVLTLEPDDDIESAAMLMQLNNIRRIPIVEDDKLAGLITYRDITNALMKSVHSLTDKAEKLEDKANRDPLTGLWNKGYLLSQLQYHFELSKRTGNPMAVIVIDIDHFKKVNDTYGHICGDEVLKKIASLISTHSRAINITGRFGGEEFVILGPISDHKSAMFTAERLRVLVENEKFQCGDNAFKITISAGVSVWNRAVNDATQLLANADKALYEAKGGGRNQVRLAEPS